MLHISRKGDRQLLKKLINAKLKQNNNKVFISMQSKNECIVLDKQYTVKLFMMPTLSGYNTSFFRLIELTSTELHPFNSQAPAQKPTKTNPYLQSEIIVSK